MGENTTEIADISVSQKTVRYAGTGTTAGINILVNGEKDAGDMVVKYSGYVKNLKGKTLHFEGEEKITSIVT